MKIDTSEVKTYRECHRKHQFSSRNRFHLRPVTPNNNLVFGTQFHEVLAMIYLGTSEEKIRKWIDANVTDVANYQMMLSMFEGYYNGPYQKDKERFTVVDTEKSFNFPVAARNSLGQIVPGWACEFVPATNLKDSVATKDAYIAILENGEVAEAICVCGSIDMICVDNAFHELIGFEHKTAKNFRPEVYDLLDEQPRVYSVALKKILEDYHKQGKLLDVATTGPIYLNQVKKLKSRFDYQRVACKYTDEDLDRFMEAFVETCDEVAWRNTPADMLPQPGYMKCQMCDYADLCMHYGYATIDSQDLLKEFEGEFEVRDKDHLEEKVSTHVDA